MGNLIYYISEKIANLFGVDPIDVMAFGMIIWTIYYTKKRAPQWKTLSFMSKSIVILGIFGSIILIFGSIAIHVREHNP